jgi:hypothetical protein
MIMTVTREGDQLLTRLTGQRPVPIYAESNTEFFAKVVDAQISFITDARGQAESLILHQGGRDMPMPRLDEATAQEIEGKRAEKLRSQSPSPGTEAALRRLIDGVISGEPNYHEMGPGLAQATRDQIGRLHAELAPLGAVQSIRFLGVGNNGADVYIVKQESGEVHHWRIALDSKGTIWFALVSPGL